MAHRGGKVLTQPRSYHNGGHVIIIMMARLLVVTAVNSVYRQINLNRPGASCLSLVACIVSQIQHVQIKSKKHAENKLTMQLFGVGLK